MAVLKEYCEYVMATFPEKIHAILEKIELCLPEGVTMVRDESKQPVDWWGIQLCGLRKGNLDITVYINIHGKHELTTLTFTDFKEDQEGPYYYSLRTVSWDTDSDFFNREITEMFRRMSERIKPPMACAKSTS